MRHDGDNAQDAALGRLLAELQALDYRFVPPSPETHRRAIAGRSEAKSLRDIFGWSLPFQPSTLPSRLRHALDESGMARHSPDGLRSMVRVASVEDALFIHSAYPTHAADSVFFGPDSYRFVAFVARELAARPGPTRIVDIGTGSGVGAIMAAGHAPDASLLLTDVNPLALRFARINARHNGVTVEAVEGSGADAVEGPIELAISNPPFIKDAAGRAYRDGGEMHGAALSLEWALQVAAKLAPGGRMLLYTASAIVDGQDGLKSALADRLPGTGCNHAYREIDPDIFGEQLDEPGYDGVERIAAVGITIEKRI